MKNFYKVKAFAVALVIAAAGFIPAVAHCNDAKQNIEGIIEYNLQKSSAASVQEWIDGKLTRDAGAGSEWYIIALSNYGEYDFSDYKNALNIYLSENEIGSASSRLKFALTYIAIDDKTNPYINKTLGNSIGEQGIMSLVFGLHLLNNGCVCDVYSLDGLISELLSLQLADGGFSVTGEYGDVDVTAMTVQALSAHYNDNSEVKSSVDKALGFLSAHQLENGGYSGYGVANPESAAQVVIALSSLGIDVCCDNRFIKNGNTVFDGISGFRLADGSFCHKEGGASDSTATAQVFSASISYENMKKSRHSFYDFVDIKNYSEETITKTASAETSVAQAALTESASITENATFIESTSKMTNVTANRETDTQKAESAETVKTGTNSVRLAIILVCIVSILICAFLFAAKRKKLMVLVVVLTVAVIALIISIFGGNNPEKVGSVTVGISCDIIKDKDKSYIPQNGIILEETVVEIRNGDTVYDVLAEACKENGILFSSNMGYIEGINNIYEMDFGDNSGWIYFVNGESPSVGCGNYVLADGDKIEWHYTCELGKDLDIKFEKEYN